METELAYDRLDYIGEVYRMNISCLNGDDGCLFFKVLGTTDLTKGWLTQIIYLITADLSKILIM